MSRRFRRVAALAATLPLVVPAAAAAAPPANDDRAAPAVLGALPASVSGTTVGATRETTDPPTQCAAPGPQVWYRFLAPADGRVVVRLTAAGDLDASIDAYLSERSQTVDVGCDVTDKNGQGGLDLRVKKGDAYLIAVNQLPNSVPGTFQLNVVAPQPAPTPPGRRLPAGGVAGTLDRIGNPQDAYSVRLRRGRTYRFRLVGRGEARCSIAARLYGPGATSFSGAPARRFGCDDAGYVTYTPGPGESGVYSILLNASRGVRAAQPYHLQSAGAGDDDLAPGRFLGNLSSARGSLDGARIDALDLYRFRVTHRSDLDLKLAAGDTKNFSLLLLNENGRRIQCECFASGDLRLRRQLRPGRYFVAVRARDASRGTYRLSRVSRLITRTSVAANGRAKTGVPVGSRVSVDVHVRPAVNGPVTVVIERFDPLSGWLFSSLRNVRLTGGHATVSFVPTAVGRWRVRASFDGTLGAASSRSGFAGVLVT